MCVYGMMCNIKTLTIKQMLFICIYENLKVLECVYFRNNSSNTCSYVYVICKNVFPT